ncbi:zinc ribbon domain-containing protein [Latilactobacillus sakei]|uniref:zinc ribbon domain-containing protein n=1 Tax=Latilactobacillus sakei TaxID=1599 RepID=UPI0020C7C4CA|nr:zinc ribbon domain-containing protein [Latilactobacillus sakei]MCP8856436.1 zinc ribbon domain-containing protein [Latilactobacillus sakei]
MICPSCKAENKLGAKFCVKCGAALEIRPITEMEIPQANQIDRASNNVTGNFITRILGDKKRLSTAIILIALVCGGGYLWFLKNSTHEIAGDWRLITANGKRVDKGGSRGDFNDLLTIDNQGNAVYTVLNYDVKEAQLTGIKLKKVNLQYRIINPEKIKITVMDGVDEFNEIRNDDYITKVDKRHYRLTAQNVNKIKKIQEYTPYINTTIGRLSLLLKDEGQLFTVNKSQLGYETSMFHKSIKLIYIKDI